MDNLLEHSTVCIDFMTFARPLEKLALHSNGLVFPLKLNEDEFLIEMGDDPLIGSLESLSDRRKVQHYVFAYIFFSWLYHK